MTYSGYKPAMLVGMGIGDALGMPFEKPDDSVHPDLSGWDGKYKPGTWHKLPPGHWTDDTEMSACLAESLIAKSTYDIEDVAKRYLAWFKGTPHGMGGTTKAAMALLDEGNHPSTTGQPFANPHKVGSGTAMRIAPLGWFCRVAEGARGQQLTAWVTEDAKITHDHPEARAAALAVAAAVQLHDVKDAGTWLRAVGERVQREMEVATLVGERIFHASSLLELRATPGDLVAKGVIGRRGNAWQIVSSALYCCAIFWDSFDAAVLNAVSLGGDCDTRGAIVGAIMGARRGLDKIPSYMREGLLKFEYLASLDEQLSAL